MQLAFAIISPILRIPPTEIPSKLAICTQNYTTFGSIFGSTRKNLLLIPVYFLARNFYLRVMKEQSSNGKQVTKRIADHPIVEHDVVNFMGQYKKKVTLVLISYPNASSEHSFKTNICLPLLNFFCDKKNNMLNRLVHLVSYIYRYYFSY